MHRSFDDAIRSRFVIFVIAVSKWATDAQYVLYQYTLALVFDVECTRLLYASNSNFKQLLANVGRLSFYQILGDE